MLQPERPTSYNLQADQGMDDMVLAKQWGVAPSYAYTPEINQQIVNKVAEHTRKIEYEEAINKGFSSEDATVYADRITADGVKRANKNIKETERFRKNKK
jgi:hypothetical protein